MKLTTLLTSSVVLLFATGQSAAETAVYFNSAEGDYIGQGIEQLWVSPGDDINFSNSDGFVKASTGGFNMSFESPNNLPLIMDHYQGAVRYPFNSGSAAGLSVSGNGRGCNELSGHYEIIEIAYDTNNQINLLALDFVQHCESKPNPLFGAIRLNSDIPTQRGVPYALAGIDEEYQEGSSITLNGSAFSLDNSIVDYHWQVESTTPITLLDAGTATPSFIAPMVPIGGEDITFILSVTDSVGATDSDKVTLHINSISDPQTYLHMSSESGDYIGAGKEWHYTQANAEFSARENYDNGVDVNVSGGSDRWDLRFAAANDITLTEGQYENATRLPFQDGTPGLSVSGDGRGCNKLTGKFQVNKIKKTGATVESFSADFEQHCEGSSAALIGEIRINAIDPSVPTANAGTDFSIYSGLEFVLDSSLSEDSDGVIIESQWNQISGPSIDIGNGLGERLYITAPDNLGSDIVIFEVTVTDNKGFSATDQVELTVLETSDLTVSLVGAPGINEEGLITFEALISNIGEYNSSNTSIDLVLPAGVSFISASNTQDCSALNLLITCQLINIAAGSEHKITFIVSTGDFTEETHDYQVAVSSDNDFISGNNNSNQTFGGSLALISLLLISMLAMGRKFKRV